MRVAVLVLHALAVQCRATGGAAEQEALAHHVAAGPDHVADALKAEHRIEDVERHHGQAVVGVGGARRQERRHGSGLADALLENLAVLGFPIRCDRARIHRFVVLTGRRIDARLGEQAVHAEGARLVRHDGHDVAPETLLPQKLLQHAHHGHGGRHRATAGAVEHVLEERQRRRFENRTVHGALRQRATQGLPTVLEVAHLVAVVRRPVEVGPLDLLPGQGDSQPLRQRQPLGRIQVLLLMDRVAALDVRAEAVALHRLQQQHAGLAGDLLGLLEGRVDLLVVVAAALDGADLLVGERAHQVFERLVVFDPVLADDITR